MCRIFCGSLAVVPSAAAQPWQQVAADCVRDFGAKHCAEFRIKRRVEGNSISSNGNVKSSSRKKASREQFQTAPYCVWAGALRIRRFYSSKAQSFLYAYAMLGCADGTITVWSVVVMVQVEFLEQSALSGKAHLDTSDSCTRWAGDGRLRSYWQKSPSKRVGSACVNELVVCV